MLQKLAVSFLAIGISALAQNASIDPRWTPVEALNSGAPLLITQRSGQPTHCTLSTATPDSIACWLDEPSGPPVRLVFARETVQQVWLFETLPRSGGHAGLVVGAISGVVTGAAAGAPDSAKSAFLGAVACGLIGAGIGALVDTVPDPMPDRFRIHRRLIYNAPPPPKPSH